MEHKVFEAIEACQHSQLSQVSITLCALQQLMDCNLQTVKHAILLFLVSTFLCCVMIEVTPKQC